MVTNAGVSPLTSLQVTVSAAPSSASIITGTGTLADSLSLAPTDSTLLSLSLDPGQVSDVVTMSLTRDSVSFFHDLTADVTAASKQHKLQYSSWHLMARAG